MGGITPPRGNPLFQTYQRSTLIRSDLDSAIRGHDRVLGSINARFLFDTEMSLERRCEVGLLAFEDDHHHEHWKMHRGNEGNMGDLSDNEAAAMLVHSHPSDLQPTPSRSDTRSAKEYPEEGARAVVSADGVYVFHKGSQSTSNDRSRKVSGMVLIPTLDADLVNDHGRLLIYPLQGSFLPIRFVNEA